MRNLVQLIFLVTLCFGARQVSAQTQNEPPKLKTRTDVSSVDQHTETDKNAPWIIPAGTKFPVQLRQALSTKDAKPGDPIYAQTVFPVMVDGKMMIPAGTYVQGQVDSVTRAGRIKGTAEMRFHLTRMIFANGYNLDIAAAIDRVPDTPTHMKEPGTVKHDSQVGDDVKQVLDSGSKGAAMGATAGTLSGSVRGIGVGGVSGMAIGVLIAVLGRGADVRFETGTVVDVSLNGAVVVDKEKVMSAASAPAQSPQ